MVKKDNKPDRHKFVFFEYLRNPATANIKNIFIYWKIRHVSFILDNIVSGFKMIKSSLE